ncbi:MAG: hypothetical protein QOF81_1184 [Acidimicrobiaceae bacterium]|jgi:hypothetical protein|nr:hypothetical protein [Acidimicrobiaceae bacterium]
MLDNDTTWMAVSRATQMQTQYRAELRRARKQARQANGLRIRMAGVLVRAGLRIAGPLTIESLLGTR